MSAVPEPTALAGDHTTLEVGGLELQPHTLGRAWEGGLQWNERGHWRSLSSLAGDEAGEALLDLARRPGGLGLVTRALGQRTELKTGQGEGEERADVEVALLPLHRHEHQALSAQLSAGVSWGGPSRAQLIRQAKAVRLWEDVRQGLASLPAAARTPARRAQCAELNDLALSAAAMLEAQALGAQAEAQALRDLGMPEGGAAVQAWVVAERQLRDLQQVLRALPPLDPSAGDQAPAGRAAPELDGARAETWEAQASDLALQLRKLAGQDQSYPAADPQALYEGLVANDLMRELARLGFSPAGDWTQGWSALWNGHQLQEGELTLEHRGVGGMWQGRLGEHPTPGSAPSDPLRVRVQVQATGALGRAVRLDLISVPGDAQRGTEEALRETPPGAHSRRRVRRTAQGPSISPRPLGLVLGARLDALEHPEEMFALLAAVRRVRARSGEARPPLVSCAAPRSVSGTSLAQWSAAPLPGGLRPGDAAWRVSSIELHPDLSARRDLSGLRRLVLAWLLENRVVWLCPRCGEDLDRHPAELVAALGNQGQDQQIGHSDDVAGATRVPVRQKAHLVCPCCGTYAFISFCALDGCGEDPAESGVDAFLSRAMIAKYHASESAFEKRMNMRADSAMWRAWTRVQVNQSVTKMLGGQEMGEADPPCPRCGGKQVRRPRGG